MEISAAIKVHPSKSTDQTTIKAQQSPDDLIINYKTVPVMKADQADVKKQLHQEKFCSTLADTQQ